MRQPHPKDRRVHMIAMTEKGEAMVSGLEPGYLEGVHELMAGIPDRDLRSLNKGPRKGQKECITDAVFRKERPMNMRRSIMRAFFYRSFALYSRPTSLRVTGSRSRALKIYRGLLANS